MGACTSSLGFQSVWDDHLSCNLCVLTERSVPLRLNYSKYGGLLTEDNLIRLAALLIDYSSSQAILAVRNIVLDNPEIKVRVSKTLHSCMLHVHSLSYFYKRTVWFAAWLPLVTVKCHLQILGEPKENRKLAAEITLKNPLPDTLENCCFSIEGSNLTGGHVISERFKCFFSRIIDTGRAQLAKSYSCKMRKKPCLKLQTAFALRNYCTS